MYGDSHALYSSDSCSIFESISKQKEEALLREQVRDKQLLSMDSGANTFYSVFRHDLMSRVNDNSSGLLRFRSAPTSLLENFKNEKLNSRICCGDDDVANSMHVIVSENNDDDDNGCNNKRFTAMNSQLPPQYPRQGYRSALSSSDQQGQNGKFGSGLLRQNSSPAGLFSSQNGYAGGNVEFKNHMNYSSGRGPSSLGMLSRISEIENENLGPDQGKVGNSSGDNLFFTSGFQFGSWNDPTSYFAENFSPNGIKREVDNDPTNMFVNTEKCEVGNRPNILSHHLSLPKSSAEMEKLLHIQDTVPCKIRAKRGCATHPRSIAERVRRTRISERMRKLQDLVPNMDKQTNTADMLDLAVDYINSLQKQYKSLSNDRANCKCSAFQKVVSDKRH